MKKDVKDCANKYLKNIYSVSMVVDNNKVVSYLKNKEINKIHDSLDTDISVMIWQKTWEMYLWWLTDVVTSLTYCFDEESGGIWSTNEHDINDGKNYGTGS